MEGRTLKQVRDELQRLMLEQVESLKAQTFGGLTEEELRQQDERLNRIRELSADFLSALKNQTPEECPVSSAGSLPAVPWASRPRCQRLRQVPPKHPPASSA